MAHTWMIPFWPRLLILSKTEWLHRAAGVVSRLAQIYGVAYIVSALRNGEESLEVPV